MFRTRIALALLASLGAFSAASAADFGPEPNRFFLHVGPGAVILSEDATMTAGGQALAGATIYIRSQVTPIAEVGYYLTPQVAVSFTGGFPPLAKVEADGSIKGLGTVGKVRYGPMALTATYHFGMPFELPMNVRPYVGAGVVYMHVFANKDGVLTNLKVDDAFGYAGQVGVDAQISEHVGVFIDLKKAHLRTEGTGMLGPAPIAAKIKLDPLVISAGAAFRF